MKIAGLSRVAESSREASSPSRQSNRIVSWKEFARASACIAMAAQLAWSPLVAAGSPATEPASSKTPAATAATTGASDTVLKVMETELHRATTDLAKSQPAPYYLSYTVNDQDIVVLIGSYGSLLTDAGLKRRQADVTMRVGSPALDNTHGQSRSSGMTSGSLPLGDNSDAIRRVLWELTDREYKRAAPAFLNVKTNTAVRAEEEDKSPDFSKETPQTHTGEPLTVPSFDRALWEGEIRRLSGAFRKYSDVYYGTVTLQISTSNSRLVSSEGALIATPSASARMVMEAQTRSDDGMELLRVETFQAPSAAGLPSEAELTAKVDKMAADLRDLRKAPVAEPYDGPALLSGRAAAVFFHEVLGHRMEGHRQRDEDEGQTFTKKVNQVVLPTFLSVTDDPTIRELNGHQTRRLLRVRQRRHAGAARRHHQRRRAEKFSYLPHADHRLHRFQRPWPQPARPDADRTPRQPARNLDKNGPRS